MEFLIFLNYNKFNNLNKKSTIMFTNLRNLLFKSTIRAIVLIALSSATFTSCSKDEIPVVLSENLALIINQGNFTEQSASLSIYDENSNTITNRVYETANGGISIGATIISGWVNNSKKAFLVCNYPDKIEIIDAKTAVKQGNAITDHLSNPRAIAGDSQNLYVSNWSTQYVVNESYYYEYINSYIAIFDATTYQYKKSVAVGTDAEGILLNGTKLYVATKAGVVVINTSDPSFPILTTVRHPNAAGSAKNLAIDKNGKIWASFPATGLVQIEPSTNTALATVVVPVDQMDGYICSDGDGSRILTYYTRFNSSWMSEEAKIYAVDVATRTVNTLINGNYFYGVGASPNTGNIFTAEVSFSSNSVLKVSNYAGIYINSATAGIGTSRYLFF